MTNYKEYIEESVRTFGERFREHLKAPSPIYDHSNITGHTTALDNFHIVGREDHNLMRLIKEAIYLRVNNPSLNGNIGKYQLTHIWDEVLNNITECKINNEHIDPVAIPSATLAITSAILNIPTMWPFHLPQWQQHLPPYLEAIPPATIGNNICHSS